MSLKTKLDEAKYNALSDKDVALNANHEIKYTDIIYLRN